MSLSSGLRRGAIAAAMAVSFVSGCATVDNSAGVATISVDPGTRSRVAGIGIQSHDIVSMSDRMMRDMMSSPVLAGRGTPPQVLVDSELFVNESAQRLNKNLDHRTAAHLPEQRQPRPHGFRESRRHRGGGSRA